MVKRICMFVVLIPLSVVQTVSAQERAKASQEIRNASWTGLVIGVSAAAATTVSKISSNQKFTETQGINTFFDDSAAQSSPVSNVGALGDVFVGYDLQRAQDIVWGLQFEGTFSKYLSFASAGDKFDRRVTNDELQGANSASFVPHLKSNWMFSVLGRTGWLSDPKTLL
ncbi:MAG: hypothetical protein ABL962_19440, partial [Fimbriimonadaceae bacterium]